MTVPVAEPRRCYLAGLAIDDFAVIERLEISFEPGLCVLTGETGAGKSVIIDALGAALGDRASLDWIRAGADRARIEAIFAFPESVPGLAEILEQEGSPGEEGSLVLHRDIQVGRSVTRLNGRAVTGHSLDRIGTGLVDVHSQGDHVSLSRSRDQREILDRFGRLGDLRAQMGVAARELRESRRNLEKLDLERRSAEREAELLRHDAEEIESAGIQPAEEEELGLRRVRLRNALRLRLLLQDANRALFGEDGSAGAVDLLGSAAIAFRGMKQMDEGSPASEEELVDAIDGLEGLQRTLRGYEGSLEDDPRALEAIDERLLLLADLKRKYGATIEDVLAHQAESLQRLAVIDDAVQSRGEREVAERSLAVRAAELASLLSSARRDAGRLLEERVESEIQELGMPGARFRVKIEQRASAVGLQIDGEIVDFDDSGIDEVEFLVSANPGEPERPLGRAASGGELSRIMLAVKSAVASSDPVPVLIFDELDQGVGGRMGHVVGEKLWRLGRDHQVLCITHLPQVACYADHHYVVTKNQTDGRATTGVRSVSGLERIQELALMLEGVRAGEAAREGAKELLDRAAAWKEAERP